jgi:SAM-dependent methyltransferase
MIPGYDQDLAYIHDVGFGGFAQRAAPAVLQMLRASGIRRGLVVDLGCGSGLWARALVDAGYDVLGVDLSAAMIAIARKRVPEARFVRGSLLERALPRCVAVTAIGECVNYLFDSNNDSRALAGLFARVWSVLEPAECSCSTWRDRSARARRPRSPIERVTTGPCCCASRRTARRACWRGT